MLESDSLHWPFSEVRSFNSAKGQKPTLGLEVERKQQPLDLTCRFGSISEGSRRCPSPRAQQCLQLEQSSSNAKGKTQPLCFPTTPTERLSVNGYFNKRVKNP